jgi:hypothetical protein
VLDTKSPKHLEMAQGHISLSHIQEEKVPTLIPLIESRMEGGKLLKGEHGIGRWPYMYG